MTRPQILREVLDFVNLQSAGQKTSSAMTSLQATAMPRPAGIADTLVLPCGFHPDPSAHLLIRQVYPSLRCFHGQDGWSYSLGNSHGV